MPRVPRWDPDHALQNIPRQDRTSRNAGYCSRGCETLMCEVGGMCDSVWEAGGMCDSVWEAGGMCDNI